MSDVETSELRGFIEGDFGGASPEATRPAVSVLATTIAYDRTFPGSHWQVVVIAGVNTWVPFGT